MLGPLPGSLQGQVFVFVLVAVVRTLLSQFVKVEPQSLAASPLFRIALVSTLQLLVSVQGQLEVRSEVVLVAGASVFVQPDGCQRPSCFGCLVVRTAESPG